MFFSISILLSLCYFFIYFFLHVPFSFQLCYSLGQALFLFLSFLFFVSSLSRSISLLISWPYFRISFISSFISTFISSNFSNIFPFPYLFPSLFQCDLTVFLVTLNTSSSSSSFLPVLPSPFLLLFYFSSRNISKLPWLKDRFPPSLVIGLFFVS
jgi:hypothetical protein